MQIGGKAEVEAEKDVAGVAEVVAIVVTRMIVAQALQYVDQRGLIFNCDGCY